MQPLLAGTAALLPGGAREFVAGQVGDGAGELQDAVVGAARVAIGAWRPASAVAGGSSTQCTNVGRPCRRWRGSSAKRVAASRARSTRAARLTMAHRRAVGELLVLDARYVEVDVDAVQQRAGDALLVARDGDFVQVQG